MLYSICKALVQSPLPTTRERGRVGLGEGLEGEGGRKRKKGEGWGKEGEQYRESTLTQVK